MTSTQRIVHLNTTLGGLENVSSFTVVLVHLAAIVDPSTLRQQQMILQLLLQLQVRTQGLRTNGKTKTTMTLLPRAFLLPGLDGHVSLISRIRTHLTRTVNNVGMHLQPLLDLDAMTAIIILAARVGWGE